MTPEGNMTDDELIEWLLVWGRIGEEPVLFEAASRIKKLGAANLKQSCIIIDAHTRIEKLEAALDDALQYVSRADWHYLKDETRKALEENDG